MEQHYAVIGESEGYPMLYHMNQTWANAERLRQRREAATGRLWFVVPMGAWFANPLTALHEAVAAHQDGE